MHALQIAYVAIAIRQHHVERGVVHDEPAEINRRKRKHSLDAVRRTQLIIQNIMTHHALTTARMAHRTNSRQIELADELRPERRAASGIERLQDVEMFLQQLRARECAEIEHSIVDGVDSICAD